MFITRRVKKTPQLDLPFVLVKVKIKVKQTNKQTKGEGKGKARERKHNQASKVLLWVYFLKSSLETHT